MTFEELAGELAEGFDALGGSAAMLDERCIVLEFRGLRGLVCPATAALLHARGITSFGRGTYSMSASPKGCHLR